VCALYGHRGWVWPFQTANNKGWSVFVQCLTLKQCGPNVRTYSYILHTMNEQYSLKLSIDVYFLHLANHYSAQP
jgi:hypothetical protein